MQPYLSTEVVDHYYRLQAMIPMTEGYVLIDDTRYDDVSVGERPLFILYHRLPSFCLSESIKRWPSISCLDA